jgi:hypothetical protein
MKYVVICAIAAMMAATASAANVPNFSGEWKMNAAKSQFGALPAPASFVRKISHKDPSLSIIEDQAANGAESSTIRKITTDGKTTAIEMNGLPAVCSAVWDGSDLIATTVMDTVGLKFTDKMSLSADGKSLTSKVLMATSQGDAELTIVFDRQ